MATGNCSNRNDASVLACLRGFILAVTVMGMGCATAPGDEMKVPVVISGGHETNPVDRGRPVVLIAAALGVKAEVFREAFRAVTPARGRGPTGDEARKNKQALMRVLAPHGVTNERLDEVSNYYRYQPQRGDVWKNTPASAYALVENGKIKSIVVTNAGSGYSSTPSATVKGFDAIPLKVNLHFDQDLTKNGSLTGIEVAAPKSVNKKS